MPTKTFSSAALRDILFGQFALPPDAHFALAYSGGHDSHALLHALCAVRAAMQAQAAGEFRLSALHFDHAIAPQSAVWARQCEAVCRCWEVEFISQRQPVVDAPGSLEARARQSRYRWFSQVVTRDRATAAQVLLTAHHADDQAETLVLNLLRGGGGGIPPQRALSANAYGRARVVRPLLAFRRAELTEYARRHQLQWIEDPSNNDAKFDRNYLRHCILPQLENRRPGAVVSLIRAAEKHHATVTLLSGFLGEYLAACQAPSLRGIFCHAAPLNTAALQTHDRARVIALLRHWIHRHGLTSPSTPQLSTFYRQVFDGQINNDTCAGLRWNRAELRYFNGHIYLLRQRSRALVTPIDWDLRDRDLGNGLHVKVCAASHCKDAKIHRLDRHRLVGRLVQLGWRTSCKHMTPQHMTLVGRAHRSSLKKLFQQNKVPPWERDALPLLIVDGEIAWVHGIGASAAYAIDHRASQATPVTLHFTLANKNAGN